MKHLFHLRVCQSYVPPRHVQASFEPCATFEICIWGRNKIPRRALYVYLNSRLGKEITEAISDQFWDGMMRRGGMKSAAWLNGAVSREKKRHRQLQAAKDIFFVRPSIVHLQRNSPTHTGGRTLRIFPQFVSYPLCGNSHACGAQVPITFGSENHHPFLLSFTNA